MLAGMLQGCHHCGRWSYRSYSRIDVEKCWTQCQDLGGIFQDWWKSTNIQVCSDSIAVLTEADDGNIFVETFQEVGKLNWEP